ncbi:septation protein A [Uliginosibacterium aquaticum]|uniref:Inner membrane-spanning protein YciB n=1 Tax=Uliginosibacterium aquaticum TaxID=2731212 RepID=A0ABX2IR91_9RHOO|nr:septation protein A [Uliginosibacterium aquaticum]NSL56816.1 septation protein A [Uliginosibacterium aquaticum]
MKLFFDFFPVALFYAAFQYARANKELAAQKATEWFGFMVSGGVVGPTEAPTVLATVVVVLAIAAQIGWLLVRRQTVSKILWVSMAAAVIFGGATVWFHDPAFIKWKFSIVYWLMGSGFFISARFFRKNLIQALIGEGISLNEQAWHRLNLAWVLFFLGMGCLNLAIAYNFSENVWFNFKLFGSMGLTLLFALAQGLYLARFIKSDPKEESQA